MTNQRIQSHLDTSDSGEVAGTEATALSATGFIALIVNSPVTRNIDPDEVLRYFSWARYAIVATVYTACVFWIELAKDGPFIFSSQNARSKVEVLQAHTIYLLILFCCFRMSVYFVPSLPFWITDTFRMKGNTRASIVDILLCIAAYGMAHFERRWLYRERGANIEHTGALSG